MFTFEHRPDPDRDGLQYTVLYPSGVAMLRVWTKQEAELVTYVLNQIRAEHPIDRPDDLNQFMPLPESSSSEQTYTLTVHEKTENIPPKEE